TPASPGADGKLNTSDDLCATSKPDRFSIPGPVLAALDDLGLPKTVAGLATLADRALSCLTTDLATVVDIASAEDAISNGFDGCRCLLESGTSGSTAQLTSPAVSSTTLRND